MIHACDKAAYGRRGHAPFFIPALLCLTLSVLWSAFALLLPETPGETLLEKGSIQVDASRTSEGYIMVRCTDESQKLKLRISNGKSTSTYDLSGADGYECFPLQFGDGAYKLQSFRHVKGNKYAADASLSLVVSLTDSLRPFLYPNQYVNYDASSAAAALANELCASAATDEEKFRAVYEYVVGHITYDNDRARTVTSGYLPDIDDVLARQEGICFDYAALTACMLRSQGVATQLVIGYAGKIYHAWNNVWLDGAWLRCDPTADANRMKVKKYTEERVY